MLVENRIYFIPPAFHAPVMGSPAEYYHKVWYGKTSMALLSDALKKVC